MVAITSGSICEPPLMVRVAVVLMNGRTPIFVYGSVPGTRAGAADKGVPAAIPAAAAALPRRNISRRLRPVVDRLVRMGIVRILARCWLIHQSVSNFPFQTVRGFPAQGLPMILLV